MKKSIEDIWRQGFLNEKSLVAPKINDLYNQKSTHVVDKMKRTFKFNIILIVIMSIILPIVHYLLDAFWQGAAASLLLLTTAWYSNRLTHGLNTLDHGSTSFEYLKSFDRWLKDVLYKGEKIVRFSYPIYFIIAISTIWSAWQKSPTASKMYQKYPDVIFIWSIPLFVWLSAGVVTLLMLYFSDRIYRWDVRLMYGRVFDKLEETIADMEKLKQGQ